uniref:Uncharacterized protein n=1 Tax=Rhizophora mucronata TaxID=61149 RepID=A0A2P2KJ60_RHIMU
MIIKNRVSIYLFGETCSGVFLSFCSVYASGTEDCEPKSTMRIHFGVNSSKLEISVK